MGYLVQPESLFRDTVSGTSVNWSGIASQLQSLPPTLREIAGKMTPKF